MFGVRDSVFDIWYLGWYFGIWDGVWGLVLGFRYDVINMVFSISDDTLVFITLSINTDNKLVLLPLL